MRSEDAIHDDAPAPPSRRRRRPAGAGAACRGLAGQRDKAGADPRGRAVGRRDRRSCCARSTAGSSPSPSRPARRCASTAPARRSPRFAPGSSPASRTTVRARAILIEAFGARRCSHRRSRRRDGGHAVVDHAAHRGRRDRDRRLDAGTHFRFHGAPARRQLVRPGAQVAVTHAADAPATVVNVLKRAGA